MYSVKSLSSLIIMGVFLSLQFSSVTFAGLNEGLVVYLSFDELNEDTFADLSGNGNDGVIQGNPVHVDGKYGMAIENNGAANLVRIKHDDSFNPVDGKVTVMAWMNPTVGLNHAGFSYEQTILHWNDTPDEWTYHFGLHNGKVDFIMVESNGTWQQATGDTLVPPGEWHHIAGVADGNNVKAYLDGKLDKTIPYDGTCNVTATDIGIACKARGIVDGVRGIVDEVAIWNRPLSEDEIQQAMQGNITASIDPSLKLATTWGNMKME